MTKTHICWNNSFVHLCIDFGYTAAPGRSYTGRTIVVIPQKQPRIVEKTMTFIVKHQGSKSGTATGKLCDVGKCQLFLP